MTQKKRFEQMAWQLEQPAPTQTKELVVLSNHIARKCSRWSVQEAKLFFMAISKIGTMNPSDGCVQLNKADAMEFLGIANDKNRYTILRDVADRLVKSSFIQMGTDAEFADGNLVSYAEANKRTVSIWFTMPYLPLLKDLSGNFSTFFLDQIQPFKSKFTLQLFTYLRSNWNRHYTINLCRINTADLFRIFGLTLGEDYNTKSGTIDRSNFEKKTLKRAIAEINSTKCLLKVEPEYKKGRDWNGNVYYDVRFVRLDSEGRFMGGVEPGEDL